MLHRLRGLVCLLARLLDTWRSLEIGQPSHASKTNVRRTLDHYYNTQRKDIRASMHPTRTARLTAAESVRPWDAYHYCTDSHAHRLVSLCFVSRVRHVNDLDSAHAISPLIKSRLVRRWLPIFCPSHGSGSRTDSS
ncbi:hypothetical protein PSPO01_09591 [Paraphaeosphaeria sporulosa]